MLRINDMSNIIVGIYSKNEEKSFEYMYSYLTRKTMTPTWVYLTRQISNQDKELLKIPI